MKKAYNYIMSMVIMLVSFVITVVSIGINYVLVEAYITHNIIYEDITFYMAVISAVICIISTAAYEIQVKNANEETLEKE